MIRGEYDNGHQVARNRWKETLFETVFCGEGEICGVGCWEGVWEVLYFFFFLLNYMRAGKGKTIEIGRIRVVVFNTGEDIALICEFSFG